MTSSLAPGSQTAMKEPLWPVAFAPPPAPSPTAQTPLGRGRKMGLCRRATPACKAPFFSPPPQRRRRRWGGGRGWGKSYRPQRFFHRRLATWRQAKSHLTFSFLDDVRQHMASPSKIEISGSAVSESAKKNHLRGKCNANFSLPLGRHFCACSARASTWRLYWIGS